MAVTYSSIVQISATQWRLVFESDLGGTPTFYIYADGILIDSTTRTWREVGVEAGEQIQFEVLDDVNATPVTAYPGRLFMTWVPVANDQSYRVEEFVSAAWVVRTTIQVGVETYFSFTSRYLEDVTTHQFRVIPVGTNEEDGSARPFTALMVRRPDRAEMALTYASGTAKVTVSAA